MSKKKGVKYSVFMVLAILGVVLSSLLLYYDYYPSDSIICNFGEGVSCEEVSRSDYSRIYNIPVAVFGILGYLVLFLLSLILVKRYKIKHLPLLRVKTLIFYLTLVAFLFSLYLTYLELFVILGICPICIFSLCIITVMLFIAWRMV